MNAREARLKQEYAQEYPGITPGIWIPVKEFAGKLIERAYDGRRKGRFTRTFDPTHFEFRGGSDRPRSPAARTRRTDQRPGSAPLISPPAQAILRAHEAAPEAGP